MNNKAIELISTFSSSDLAELYKFIHFQSPGPAKTYIDLIKTYHSLIEKGGDFNRRASYQSIFPKAEFSDVKLRLLQSDAVKEIESFIVYKIVRKDQHVYNKALLSYHKAADLNDLRHKTLNKISRESSDDLSQDQIGYDLFIAEEIYDYAMENREEGIVETENLLDALDRDYFIKKLRYSCLVISQENVYNIKFDHGLRDQIISYIELQKLHQDPAVGLYYYCFRMLSQRSDFEHFYEYLKAYGELVSNEQSKELYTLAINFCIRALNQGDKEFGRIGIDFYTEGLKRGILLSNGKISRFTFRNIVTMAIRIGEFEQAENFIDQFKDYLDKGERESMIAFTTALVLFSKKDYGKANDEIIKVNFKDILFNLAAKALQIKIYFESQEYWVLRSHLDAMQIFLKRHKSLGYHKQNYLNIIKFTRKLINAKTKEKLMNLSDNIETEKTLTEKIWFREKVSKMLEIHTKR